MAEGDYIFEDDFEDMYFINEVEFKYFLKTLYDRILQGKYKVGKQHYCIPRSEEYKNELKMKNVKEVFLTEL